MSKQDLSPQIQAFLGYLFDGTTMRHPDEAKVMAGYPQDYPYLKIIKECKEALIDNYDDYIVAFAPKGIKALMDVLDDPTEPGSAVKLKAAVEFLNRAGVVTKEKKEATTTPQSFVFLLPPKNELKD